MEAIKHERHEDETIEGIKTEWFDVARSTTATETSTEDMEDMERRASAKEYLDLLLDLSSDFTNIEAKNGRAMKRDEKGQPRVVGPGYYDGRSRIDSIFRIAGIEEGKNSVDANSEDPYYNENPYLNKRYSLQIADEILRIDEDLADTIDYIVESKQKKTKAKEAKKEHIDAEQEKSLGRRVLGLMGYMKKKNRIRKRYENLHWRERQGREHAATVQTHLSHALSRAYSREREYGKGDNDSGVRREMHHNWDIWYERFLGDEERQKKIKRAHELRGKIFKKDVNEE